MIQVWDLQNFDCVKVLAEREGGHRFVVVVVFIYLFYQLSGLYELYCIARVSSQISVICNFEFSDVTVLKVVCSTCALYSVGVLYCIVLHGVVLYRVVLYRIV